MALANQLTAANAEEKLLNWLHSRLDKASNIKVSDVSVPQSSGLSAESVMFTASWSENGETKSKKFVARIQPTGRGLFMDYDLEMEFRILERLHKTDVPSPAPFLLEQDTKFLGSPFLVMDRVNGRVAPDDPPFTVEGWVLELTEDQRTKMAENSLKAMVALHDEDVIELGLAGIGHGDQSLNGVDRLLDYWGKFAKWALNDTNPIIDAGLEWLNENKPADIGATVLSWGDARLGNMLIDDSMNVTAIIDWEMAATGPREMDLAWWLFMLEHHSKGVGAVLPTGFKSREDEVARYEELSGHIVTNLEYFEVLAGVRLSILIGSAAGLLKGAGYIPADSPMALINPACTLLAEKLGMPPPTGHSDYYIGNR